MFKSARIKLTVWYVLITMIVTIAFSVFVFIGVDRGTRLALEAQSRRLERQFFQNPNGGRMPRNLPLVDTETLIEIRDKTILNLIFINLSVLVLSSSLGYFLAGKTLRPIEDMVTKQKRFISDAAHEIKTPLTIMKTNLEVALRNKKDPLTELSAAAKNSIEEINNLNTLVAKLIQKSRYQNSNSKNSYEPVDLRSILQDVIKELTPFAIEKGNNFDLHDQEVQLALDPTDIKMIFSNLIENSIKYSKKSSEIKIDLFEKNNYVHFNVEDNGIGISEGDLKHVFEPFYRADVSRSSTDSGFKSFGLGLAIVKDIVKKYNGKINVESKLGEGTKFLVTFPI